MNPELEKSLQIFEKELPDFSDDLLNVTNELIENKYTDFPIFIAYKDELDLGSLLFDATENELTFSINVSTLEEFVDYGIIEEEKEEEFKSVFENPRKKMCVFFVINDNGTFVFIPFAKRISDN